MKRLLSSAAASVFIFAGCSTSSTKNAPPVTAAPVAAAAPAVGLPEHSGLRLPCEMHANLCYIWVNLNGSKRLAMAVDSGSSFTVVDTKAAEEITLHEVGSGEALGPGVTADQSYTLFDQVEVRINDFVLPNQKVISLPFDYASKRTGTRTDGTLGADVLKNFIVRLDLKHGHVVLYEAGGWKPDESYTAFDMDLIGNVPIIKASLQNKSRNGLPKKSVEGSFAIDTGQVTAPLFLATDFQDANQSFFEGLGKKKQKPIPAVGGLIGYEQGKIASIKIGTFETLNVKTVFLTKANGIYSKGHVDGGIGPEILKHFDVVIDYPHKKLYLKRLK